MKFLNLAASVCLAMALVACGDDSSSSPNVPADNNLPQQDTSTVSPATNPDNPAGTQDSVPQNTTPQDSVQQGPTETTPTDSVPPTPNDSLPVTEPENPVDTDPYAVGTDVDEPSYVSTCQIKPLEKGMAMVCIVTQLMRVRFSMIPMKVFMILLPIMAQNL